MTTLTPDRPANAAATEPRSGTPQKAPAGTVALVLMTYGTPDGPDTVEQYLFNIFNDPDLIELPWYMAPFRSMLARKISKSRREEAAHNYRSLPGGRSPLNELTLAQGEAVARQLAGEGTFRPFLGMRYWHPRIDDAIRRIVEQGIEDVLLLPMYPQFARATNGSSLNDFNRALRAMDVRGLRVRAICCFPDNPKMVQAMANAIRPVLDSIPAEERASTPLLFSAHGLPQAVIDRGDPYQSHIEKTTQAVVRALGGHDRVMNCYQSRVGRQVWIKPYTEDVIEGLIREKVKRVILYPVSFITEHSETMFELDMLYGDRIREAGIEFHRISALGTDPLFIEGLADEVRAAMTGPLYTPR